MRSSPSCFHGGQLHAGGKAGLSSDAEVWRFNGATWTQIGGDGLNGSGTTDYVSVYALYSQGGLLYVGMGDQSNDGDVWFWGGSTWAKIGGDSLNGG
jgi:hypothetical protein